MSNGNAPADPDQAPDTQAAKEARLAAALRLNLRRRKAPAPDPKTRSGD